MTGPANIANAANLYSRTGSLQGGGNIGGGQDEVNFGDVLRQTVSDSINTMEQGEKASAQAITGEANIVDVVQAVNKAEMTLETVVALRDRMVQAYNDIMSMPI